MKPGLEGSAELTVGAGDCADAMGSGSVPVFATPRLAAELEDGETTVGVRIEIEHVAATPPGLTVRAKAVLERIDGRKLVFALSAEDEREPIGTGRHERVRVRAGPFLERVNGKLG